MTKLGLDGLGIFRAGVGLWLILAPLILPDSDAQHIASGAISGALMVYIAFNAERRPWLRYVQALIGLWVMASAALLDAAPSMISSMVTGHVVLFSAAASKDMFTEEDTEDEEL